MLADRIAAYIKANKKRILDFPFLIKQTDVKFVTWSLVSRMIWRYEGKVFRTLKDKYFSNIDLLEREFSVFGIAARQGESFNFGFYGCDSNKALNVCGYSSVLYVNISGKRVDAHFHCGHNIANDPQLQLTIKAIDSGIAVDKLSIEEKEIAAKAVEVGYLKKRNNLLVPKILILDTKDENEFYNLSNDYANEVGDLAMEAAENLNEFVKRYVPKHLMNEFDQFVSQTAYNILGDVFEACTSKGVLNVPENRICAEGTWMIVKK